jgi:glutaminyl-tRNA synthetase
LNLLGPKTDEDMAPVSKQNVKKAKKPPMENKVEKLSEETPVEKLSMTEFLKTKVMFHAPGQNFTTDGYVRTPQTMQLLKDHLKITGGKVRIKVPQMFEHKVNSM